MDTIKSTLDTFNSSIVKIEKKINLEAEIKCNNRDLKPAHWILIFLPPAIIFIFGLIFIFQFWGSKSVNINRFFQILPEKNDDSSISSTSRLIAFLTGIASIFIGVTMTMYYGYIIVAECNTTIVTDGLWKLFAGLGIGVIPYGINVWNKNVKENAAVNNSTNQ